MAFLQLKKYLYDDIISIVGDYVYDEIPSREEFDDAFINIAYQVQYKKVPDKYLITSVRFETLQLNVNTYFREFGDSLYVYVIYENGCLFNDRHLKKMMNFIKKYESFSNYLESYEEIDEYILLVDIAEAMAGMVNK